MPNRVRAVMTRPGGAHVLVRLTVLVAAGTLFVLVMAQSWSATSQAQANVQAERHGVAYLQPLVQFVGELTDAQSAAVRGAQPDANQIDAAIAAVDSADDTHGDALGTHRRWSDLRGRVGTLLGQHPVGEPAYTAYSAVVALAVDLARKVGDTSKLLPDPQLETYYLADAALLRVTDVLVSAGRAADLTVLAGRSVSDVAQTRISVARYQVAAASEQMSVSLHRALDSKAEDGSGSPALGPNLAGQLDGFTSAVDAFVPPTMWLQTLNKADAAAVGSGADRVRQQVRPLAGAILGELDSLLRERSDRLSTRQTWTMIAAGAGVLLLGVLLSMLLPASPRSPRGPVGADDGEEVTGPGDPSSGRPGRARPGAAPPGSARAGAARSRSTGTVPGAAGPADAVPGDAVPGEVVPGDAVPGDVVPGDDAPSGDDDPDGAGRGDREPAEELLHVGRAVRPQRRERVGDVE